MKLRALLVASVAFLTTVLAADGSSSVSWVNPLSAPFPGLLHQEFESREVGTKVGYVVWLPPGYETSKEAYPVLYFLHGFGGNESLDAPAISGLVRDLIARGKIPPTLCVFPNGGVSGYRDDPGSGVKVASMIIEELVPLIDRTYRTRPERAARAIAGFSMGGGGAVRLALTHSELFSAAASWAGGFSQGGPSGDDVPSFEISVPKPTENPVRVLLIVGYDDFTRAFHEPVFEKLNAAHYSYSLHLLNGVGHNLGLYESLTGDELLEFVTAGFAKK